MNVEEYKKGTMEAVYLLSMAVVLAYFWISFRMEALTPLPMSFPVFCVLAAVWGVLVYLFVKEVRRAFYACVIMCILACVINASFYFVMSFGGTLTSYIATLRALDSVVMAIFITPFSIGGSFVAAYLEPE